jgi:hypothetical protein
MQNQMATINMVQKKNKFKIKHTNKVSDSAHKVRAMQLSNNLALYWK